MKIIDEKSIKAIKKFCKNDADWAISVLEKLLENYWDEKNEGYVNKITNHEDTIAVIVDLPSIHELCHYNNFGKAEFPIGEILGEGSILIKMCDGRTLSFSGKLMGRIYTEYEDMPNDIPDRIITGMIEPYEMIVDEVVSKKNVLDAWLPETMENTLTFKLEEYTPAC